MKHELRSLLAVCSIVAMLLFPAHASATHGTNPPNTHDTNAWNIAGRPFTGTSGLPWQAHRHGIAYGRVNGYKVLFTARHCNGGWDRDGNNTEDGFEAQPNDGPSDGGLDSWDGYSDGELIWDRYGNYLGICDGTDLIFQPTYPGMAALHDLYHPQYGGLGAYFCTTAACP